jgi:hypothetical protein
MTTQTPKIKKPRLIKDKRRYPGYGLRHSPHDPSIINIYIVEYFRLNPFFHKCEYSTGVTA